jgi:hypothetical protein
VKIESTMWLGPGFLAQSSRNVAKTQKSKWKHMEPYKNLSIFDANQGPFSPSKGLVLTPLLSRVSEIQHHPRNP